MEDIKKTSRAADREDRERIELFQGMVQTPAWKAYMSILNAKIQDCADRLTGPSNSLDGCIAGEYVKGAMSGLLAARDIPNATIAGKDQIRRQPTQTEFDDADDL
jgi:hypothetical protein